MPARTLSSAARARSTSSTPQEKVMSVVPSVPMFCTIMSTLIPPSASGPKIEAATPGRSGTLTRVTLASSRW